ncbi:MAG TPA: penicillin acylase family protein [Steroidobacteraceae bacterium]
MTRRPRSLTRTILIAACALTAVSSAAETQWAQLAAANAAIIEGNRQVSGLHQPVRVQRDRWGVAHIYAKDPHDLFFAQGYVAAQDRLFQMELWKRSGQGRLAEVLGPSALQRDINARRLRYRGNMSEEYSSYAADTQAILEAFTDGINAYITDVQKPGAPGLPIEFRIAGFAPEPWKPSDCLNRLAAYSMMGNASTELLHAQLVALLGPDQATDLLHLDPHVKLDPAAGLDFTGLSPALLANIVSSDRRIPFPASSLRESNNWTVSGKLTASGRPLLANDPHRVIAQPSLRYIVHLSAPGWNVIGAGEPALPGVAAGHNEQIAWGFTIFGLDQEDLYLERLDPRDATLYQTPHGWKRMQVQHETIRVRGAADVDAVLHFTEHGPVLWEDGKRALALRWIGAEAGTAGYLGSLTLDRARNWQQFERAMPHWKVPSENIVYADRAGHIGEHSTGLAPLRRNFTGLLPLPDDGQFEWNGFVPNAELPHSYDPTQGFIASANHKMIPEGYRYAVGFEWAPPTRYERIKEVLDSARDTGHKLTMADMEALQTDVVSLPARRLQVLLRQTPDKGESGDEGRARKLLLDWDGALRADSPAAALFELWATHLREAVLHRVVPEPAQGVIREWSIAEIVDELATPPAAFGNPPDKMRAAILHETLAQAYQQLSRQLGSDPGKWSWGALHKVYFRHALDAAPGLGPLLDRGPVQRPGDGEVVQATSFDADSFDQVAGASYREIFDLSDWDKSVAVNVPGQSGQPGSKHFDDLLPLWSAGKYFPLKFSKAAVDRVTTDTLTLHP